MIDKEEDPFEERKSGSSFDDDEMHPCADEYMPHEIRPNGKIIKS